jgi:hypothetical protein
MPQINDNEDGTKTFSINSDELGALKQVLEHTVPDLEKMLGAVDGPLRLTLSFVRSVVN